MNIAKRPTIYKVAQGLEAQGKPGVMLFFDNGNDTHSILVILPTAQLFENGQEVQDDAQAETLALKGAAYIRHLRTQNILASSGAKMWLENEEVNA